MIVIGSQFLKPFCRLLKDIIRGVIVVRNAQESFDRFDDEILHSHTRLMDHASTGEA